MADQLKRLFPDAKFNIPEGAFYIFADMTEYIKNAGCRTDEEFAEKILKECRVITTPGSFFGENGKNFIRFTFVSEDSERINQGFERMRKLKCF